MAQKTPKDQGSAPVISTGIFKGMKLATPPGQGTRPTSAKTRAAAMNSLQSRLSGSAFCDLFAGSGAIGIEAVSRGATSCTFVESAPPALGALNRNLAECERRSLAQDLEPPAFRVVNVDARKFLGTREVLAVMDINHRNDRSFDILWADPPYALAREILPDLLAFADIHLRPGGALLLETGTSVAGEQVNAGTLRLKSEKKYGGTYITTWEKEA